MRFARLYLVIAALVVAPALAACGDDPLFPDVAISSDTVTLTVPGGTAPSALDLVRIQAPFTLLRRPELVQDAGEWDVTLRRNESGALVFRTFSQPGSPYRGAGIRTTTEDFERIDEAPRATTAYTDQPVPVTVGGTYYFRSRQYPSQRGTCVNYARARVVAMDAAAGTARVAIAINDNCDDERLRDD